MAQQTVARWDDVDERGGPVRSARARLAGGHQRGRADLTVNGTITCEAPVVNDRIIVPPRLGSRSRFDGIVAFPPRLGFNGSLDSRSNFGGSVAFPPRLGRCSSGSSCSCICGGAGGRLECWSSSGSSCSCICGGAGGRLEC